MKLISFKPSSNKELTALTLPAWAACLMQFRHFLELRSQVNYEGQAAIELEAIANPDIQEFYEFNIIT